MDRDGQGVSDVQTPGDIRGRERDVEETLGLWFSIWESMGFEEALGLPPVVPRRLNSDGVITAGHWLGEVFGGESGQMKCYQGRVQPSPFFSPGGVVFTNAASACFFSLPTFTFFSPAVVFAVTFAVLAASFASFSNLFASFLAGNQSHKHLQR